MLILIVKKTRSLKKNPYISTKSTLHIYIDRQANKLAVINLDVVYQYYQCFCGGVIVSNKKIISAAHCLKKAKLIKVIAGHSRRV